MFTKYSTVYYNPRDGASPMVVRARVVTVHRDGRYTIQALFYTDKDGKDMPGYLGFKYRYMRASVLRATP